MHGIAVDQYADGGEAYDGVAHFPEGKTQDERPTKWVRAYA
jgi:hypothetical protein